MEWGSDRQRLAQVLVGGVEGAAYAVSVSLERQEALDSPNVVAAITETQRLERSVCIQARTVLPGSVRRATRRACAWF